VMEKTGPGNGHCNTVFESKSKKQNQETDIALQCLNPNVQRNMYEACEVMKKKTKPVNEHCNAVSESKCKK